MRRSDPFQTPGGTAGFAGTIPVTILEVVFVLRGQRLISSPHTLQTLHALQGVKRKTLHWPVLSLATAPGLRVRGKMS